jgi:hypothetical protein
MTTTEAPKIRFDIFYRHDDLTDSCSSTRGVPDAGGDPIDRQSYEGRDIWVATLTNLATGAAEDKPAFWSDGNIHAAELTASTAVLYFLNELLTKHGSDAEITQLPTRARSISARA